jgi:phosphotransferase system enzyme I (PtsI)
VDGKEIMVFANISKLSDLGNVLQNDAGGIGLFRTEFLYLEHSDYPTEEEQFKAYKTVAETMASKKVIFRTLDIGTDKKVSYFNLPKENNPALGMRAIRICLTRPEIFKTQLRALYRASTFGNVAVMFPMIASLWEIRKVKEISDEVKRDLTKAGIPFSNNIEIGVMIETPAAAIISDILAKEVDFFSIGTNDLIAYTLATDRQSQSIEMFADPHHEAVLRLIKMTADNAHKAGIYVGICGELAADLTLTEQFVRMGIDELSVAPPVVLPLREKIMQSRYAYEGI